MGWSYRKRIKIIPGVHLNLSSRGLSTSIGVRGANVTFGRNGTFLNTGIPGTGISYRQKISGGNPQQPLYNTPPSTSPPAPVPSNSSYQWVAVGQPTHIFSADVQRITSQDMQGIKEAILIAHNQKKELISDLLIVNKSVSKSKMQLLISYILLYGFIVRSVSRRYREELITKKDAVVQIEQEIENSYVDLDLSIDPAIQNQYNQVIESFKDMAKSAKIWDVTTTRSQDTRITRSSASSLITKEPVHFCFKTLSDLRCSLNTPYMQNANGADLYFYPTFILMYTNQEKFAIIGLNEIELLHSSINFVEDEQVPYDSKIIRQTWSKVNKDGSPDRRFSGNRQIPVVRYGKIALKTSTGLNEEYQFSNYEASEQFACAFLSYQRTLGSLKNIVGDKNYFDDI